MYLFIFVTTFSHLAKSFHYWRNIFTLKSNGQTSKDVRNWVKTFSGTGHLRGNFCRICKKESIWATIWQNQQNECAPSEDSPSLISVFACDQWVAKDPRFLHADSEDSDQTGRMPRLIWVFAGRTLTLLVLSCRGSYNGSWRSLA